MFDARQFLSDNFDTPSGVVAILGAYGQPVPTVGAAEKWFQRNALPGEWLAILLAVKELDGGQPVSVSKYIGREEQPT